MWGGDTVVVIEWLRANEALLWALGALSVGSVVVAIFLTPWAISLMAADYFMPDRDRSRAFGTRHPAMRWAGVIMKNIAGVVLVIVGILLLALPGQGLLTILAGLVLMNFPGKMRFELWIIRLPMVLGSVNWLRRRSGKEPLQLPPA